MIPGHIIEKFPEFYENIRQEKTGTPRWVEAKTWAINKLSKAETKALRILENQFIESLNDIHLNNQKRLSRKKLKQLARNNSLQSQQRKPKKIKIKRVKPVKTPNSFDYHAYIKSDKWRAIRNRIVKNTPYCCVCGEKHSLAVHHISYQSRGNEKDEHLVVFCSYHHEDFHKKHKTKTNMTKETHRYIQENKENRKEKTC